MRNISFITISSGVFAGTIKTLVSLFEFKFLLTWMTMGSDLAPIILISYRPDSLELNRDKGWSRVCRLWSWSTLWNWLRNTTCHVLERMFSNWHKVWSHFLTLVKMILISKAAWLSALVFMATVLKIALAVLIVEMVAMAVQIHFANLP